MQIDRNLRAPATSYTPKSRGHPGRSGPEAERKHWENQTMKTWNYLTLAALVAAGSLMVGTSPARAAEKAAKRERPARTSVAQDRLQQMAEQLNLTADQKEKIKPILQEEAEKLKTIRRDTNLTPEQKREKARELRAEIANKLKPILTPEQLQKWQKRGPAAGPRGEKKARSRSTGQ